MNTQLVTDRTSADLAESKRLNGMKRADMTAEEWATYQAGKGSYQYSDWNRVATACEELYGLLEEAGYTPTGYVTLPTNMAANKRPTLAQLDQYIATIASIKAALPAVTPIPSTWKKLTIEGANNIERMLLEIDAILTRIKAVYIRSGVFNSGYQHYAVETAVRYQRVEYLIATKGIPIVGTKLNNDTELRARVYRPSSAVGQYIYQSDSGSSLRTNFTAYTSSGSATANWRFGSTTASIAVPMGDWHETKQSKNGIWIDDSKVATYSSVSAFTTTNDLTIHGTAASANMRIAWIERYVNNALAAKYLPVHDLVDDKYGYIDTSDGMFYTNDDAVITAGGAI